MTVWILTYEYNDYDQYGEYFQAVFINKPSAQQLIDEGVPEHSIAHVLEGGGQSFNKQDYWYYLREVAPK